MRQELDRTLCFDALVAHHEAGHAVAHIMLRCPFKFVTINPRGESAGRVQHLPIKPELSNSLANKHGHIALAGPLAQRRFKPGSELKNHAAQDFRDAEDYALKCGGSRKVVNARLKLWELEAREMVECRWTLIERLAAALIERRTLTFSEAKAVCFQTINRITR